MVDLRFEPVPFPQDHRDGNRREVTHYLRLPRFIDPADIEFLVQCQYSRAAWQVEPQEELSEGSAVTLSAGILRVGGYSVLHGPYISDPAHPAGFSGDSDIVYALTTLWDRGDRPIEGEGDRDGIIRVFAPDLPVRQELRAAHLLIALARRLDGTVHFTATEPETSRNGQPAYGPHNFRTVTPDPQASVDLTIYTDVWLEPQAALAVTHTVAPRAVFADQGQDWTGPPKELAAELEATRANLAPETLKHIHEVADENDMDALEYEETASAYAIFITDSMGVVSLEIGGTEYVPPALEGMEWAGTGVLEYRISWVPFDIAQSNQEVPGVDFVIYRAQVLALIRKLAHALYQHTGGEVADQEGFLLDPQQL